ncbi:hypothetical protein FS837_005616 [Tulasnella sp. UAMH 9824]|nr:hypothetical protein FS837_005616 [Tulasnella sp. UAMH 9824]
MTSKFSKNTTQFSSSTPGSELTNPYEHHTDSGSMEGARWQQAREALQEVVEMAVKWDKNGVDIYFLNSRKCAKGCTKAERVTKLFDEVSPNGWTPTGARLKELITPYLDTLSSPPSRLARLIKSPPKPRVYIVITDGAATDQGSSRVDNVVLGFMDRLDEQQAPLTQLGIQFVQVGNDQAARTELERLDDRLSQDGTRASDIVDTFPFDKLNGDVGAEHIIKILLGSVHKRIDNYNRL